MLEYHERIEFLSGFCPICCKGSPHSWLHTVLSHKKQRDAKKSKKPDDAGVGVSTFENSRREMKASPLKFARKWGRQEAEHRAKFLRHKYTEKH